MRRLVDHALCALPFETTWYQERGVRAHYVGHPYFDELPDQRLDAEFLAQEQKAGGTVIGLLPGSRTQEVEKNVSTLLRTAARVHEARPDTRFLVACFKPAHREYVQARLRRHTLPVAPCVGRTPEIIHLARACVAVSGSVGLELLYHGTPTVVVYRVSRVVLELSRWFMTAPYISLVNLLAEKELFPEFLSHRAESEAVSDHVLRWLNDASAYDQICNQLRALRGRVAAPGACDRAARYVLDALDRRGRIEKAA
jgi:lipid-A-disaccharide synthase